MLTDIAFGEFDGNPGIDLVVAHSGGVFGPPRIRVLSNDGAGALEPWVDISRRITSRPNSVAVGDLNGDNRPDIVAGVRHATTVSVALSGPGRFRPGGFFSVISTVNDVVVTDLDGDGDNDIVVTLMAEDSVGVLINTTGQ